MWQWFGDSRGKVIAILLVIWLLAFSRDFRLPVLIYPGAAVILVTLLDILSVRWQTGSNYFSLSSLVTGLLIGLILDPSGGFWPLVLAAFAAVVSKQFVRTPGQSHIFNPAAFGIVSAALVFQESVAWWSVLPGWAPLLVLAVGMSLVLRQLHRFWMPLTFLAVYFLINLLNVGVYSSLRLLFDGPVFLFAFVMLPEPVTSLGRGKWEYIWGILVGFLVLLQNFFGFSLGDPFLVALLAADLVGFLWLRNQNFKSLSGNA